MRRLALALLAIGLITAGSSFGAKIRAPHVRVAPKIAGAALEGQTLSAQRGRWANRPTRFRYAWQSCDSTGRACAKVLGAKRSRYRIRTGDVGHRLRIVVTATNRAGRGSARSVPTPLIDTTRAPHYYGTDRSRDCVDRSESSCSLPNVFPRPAASCAASIIPSKWEPRHDNDASNYTPGDGSYTWGPAATDPWWAAWAAKVPLVQGQFTGRTTEMFSWAACRWGIDEDTLRAVAVIESTWHQSTWGDRCGGGDATIGSFSVMQIKNKDCNGSLVWGGMPDVVQSTALAVDLYAARTRACYNGDFYDGGSWLYHGQTVRQIAAAHGWQYVFWGCVGSWYSGSWYDSGAVNYIHNVQLALAQRTWLGY